MQLQIHLVKPSNIDDVDFYSHALALYIPEYCAEKLSSLVVRANEL